MATKYVRTTGNDATGDGSIGNPFRTPLPAGYGGASQAVAGDTIDVGSGTFDLGTSVFCIPAPIIFTGAGTSSTTITASNAQAPGHAVACQFDIRAGGTLTGFTYDNTGATPGYSCFGYVLDRVNEEVLPLNYFPTQGQLAATTVIMSNVRVLGNSDALHFLWQGSDADTDDVTFDPPPITVNASACWFESNFDAINNNCSFNVVKVAWPGLVNNMSNCMFYTHGPFNGGGSNAASRAASNYAGNLYLSNCTMEAFFATGASPTTGWYTTAIYAESGANTTASGCTLISNATNNAAIWDAYTPATGTITLTGSYYNATKVQGRVNKVGLGTPPPVITVTSLTKSGSDIAGVFVGVLNATKSQWSSDGGGAWTDTNTATTFTATGLGNAAQTISMRSLDANGNVIGIGSGSYTVGVGEGVSLFQRRRRRENFQREIARRMG